MLIVLFCVLLIRVLPSVELCKEVVARVGEGVVDELLVQLQGMQVAGRGGGALNDRQQQQQQHHRWAKSVKELGDHALRVQRRVYDVVGRGGGPGM